MNNDYPMLIATIASFIIIASSIMFQNYGISLNQAGNSFIQANISQAINQSENITHKFTEQAHTSLHLALVFLIFGEILFFVGLIFILQSLKEAKRKAEKLKYFIYALIFISIILFIIFLCSTLAQEDLSAIFDFLKTLN